jgi:hypothetical protein
MIDVTIDYWDGALPLRSVRIASQRDWNAAPREGVVFVTVHYDDPKPRTLRLVGSDHYFLCREAGVWIAGGWTDPWQPWASADRAGTLYRIDDAGGCESQTLAAVPDFLDHPAACKHGVMIPEPFAQLLGLTGDAPREEGCCG